MTFDIIKIRDYDDTYMDKKTGAPICSIEPCKKCKYMFDLCQIKVEEWHTWVTCDNDDREIKRKLIMNNHKRGFKCNYNGIESFNPNDLKKGACIYK